MIRNKTSTFKMVFIDFIDTVNLSTPIIPTTQFPKNTNTSVDIRKYMLVLVFFFLVLSIVSIGPRIIGYGTEACSTETSEVA